MTRRLPSLNALRAFEAAGRHGRMTLAADELHVTHSAISRQVQHLEQVLGVALFEGPKNALRLTEAGNRLMSGLTPAFDQLDMAVRSVADTDEGTLDVSCPGTFTMRWLIPRLYRFRAEYPGIEVRLSASSQPLNVARDSFDVAIRAGSAPWPDALEVTHLFDEQIGPVVSPGLAQSVANDVNAVPLLHSRSRRHAWADWSMRAGVSITDRSANEYEHFYFMLEAASAGLGVCIAPWQLVADDVRAGVLVAPRGFIGSGQSYVALRRPRQHRKSTMFCAWLAQEASGFTPPPI
jgi:LysR family glycine cleavage system transcriptional activator